MNSQKNTISPPVIYFDATQRRREKMRLASLGGRQKAAVQTPSNDSDTVLPVERVSLPENIESQDAGELQHQASSNGVVERVKPSDQPFVPSDFGRPKSSFEHSEEPPIRDASTEMIPTDIGVLPETGDLVAINPADLADFMINYVVEQTGYPTDMVEMDADLEADLGIDSITLALMLGAIRDRYGVMPQGDLSLDDFATLNHVRDIFLGASSERIGSSLPRQS